MASSEKIKGLKKQFVRRSGVLAALFLAIGFGLTGILIKTQSKAAEAGFSFGAAGDHGNHAESAAVFQAAGASGISFFLSNGDLSYNENGGALSWCSMVKSKLGTIPEVALNGNHEEVKHLGNNGDDINTIISASCVAKPTALNIQDSPYTTGTAGTAPTNYGREFYFDYPTSSPTARFISVSPGINTINGGIYDYSVGTPRYDWVQSKIKEAKAAGMWVVVNQHIPYLNAGTSHGSQDMAATEHPSVKPFFNMLLSEKVDLILAAHDHNYQRTKQIGGAACAGYNFNVYTPTCVANASNTTYEAGAGSIMIITGSAGGNEKDGNKMNGVDYGDPDAQYLASAMGSNSPNATFGFSKFDITSTSITGSFVPGVGQTGGFTDNFTITKAATSTDGEAPTVSVTAPTANEIITGTKTLTATAADNVGVTKVEFYVGTSKVGEDTTAPYTFDWPSTTVTNGDTTVTAKAYDAANNPATSTPVAITVSNPAGTTDTEKPTVSLTAPAANATLTGNAPLTATAADNIGVTKVRFYDGSTVLGEDTTAPYTLAWLTTTRTNGSANLTAVAYDAAGNHTTSAAVPVTIDNPTQAAPVTFTVPGTESTIDFSATGSCAATSATSEAKTATAEVTGSVLAGAGFSLNCSSPGASAQVTINLGKVYDNAKIRVFKQVAGQTSDVSGDVTVQDVDVAGKPVTTIMYTLVDGGFGDDDKAANGKIVDPVFVSLAPTVSTGGSGAVTGTNEGADGTPAPQATSGGQLADTGAGRYALIVGSVLALGLGVLATVVFLFKSRDEENLQIPRDPTIISN